MKRCENRRLRVTKLNRKILQCMWLFKYHMTPQREGYDKPSQWRDTGEAEPNVIVI